MSKKINISIKVVINKIKYIGKLYTDINFTVMYEYKTLKIKFKHKYKLRANLTLNSIKNTSYMIHSRFIFRICAFVFYYINVFFSQSQYFLNISSIFLLIYDKEIIFTYEFGDF